MQPETQYAESGDVSIAYQVLGDGPFDLVFVPEWFNNIEVWWEEPRIERFLRRLASFSRLVVFDKRGTGVSDPIPLDRAPVLETWTDDIGAVMDAVSSERAALWGHAGGGQICLLFAATFPQRVESLVLSNSWAKFLRSDDYPIGRWSSAEEPMQQRFPVAGSERLAQRLTRFAPSLADDEQFHRWFGRYERLAASPTTMRTIGPATLRLDVRNVLTSIQAPTLVMHRDDSHINTREYGRYLADHIPGARFVELSGTDHVFFSGDTAMMLDHAEEFLTGERVAVQSDRVLATVLFTDIVRSTETMAELGDRGWREILPIHDSIVMRQLDRFRGRRVNTTGDGILASFDGPGRAVHCAHEIVRSVRSLDLEVRAGLHTGEIEIVGGDVTGIAVNIAHRVHDLAGPSEVWVSRTVKDLVAGSGIEFVDRGARSLKGVPEEWQLYEARLPGSS